MGGGGDERSDKNDNKAQLGVIFSSPSSVVTYLPYSWNGPLGLNVSLGLNAGRNSTHGTQFPSYIVIRMSLFYIVHVFKNVSYPSQYL